MKISARITPIFLLFFFFCLPAFAKIAVDSVKGSLLITGPDGNVKLVDEGENVPAIEEQSMIEVFNGEFKLSADAGEKIKVACGNNEGAVGGGASISLNCAETGGLLKVLSGTVHLTDIDGKESDLQAGAEQVLKMIPAKAKPVGAAPNTLGTPSAPPAEPDSRSIEASVSQ